MVRAVEFTVIGLLVALTLGSCEDLDLVADVPRCVEREIRKIKREEVRNPPAKVWRLTFDNAIYYYITSDCCDQFNLLYDTNCDVVCAPDGGFTGRGDGNCPDLSEAIAETLIWEDNR